MDLSSKSNPDLCSRKKPLIILTDLALTFDQKVKQCGGHQCYLPPFCTQDVSHSNTLNVSLIVNKHKDKTNRGRTAKMDASEIRDCEKRRVIGERKRGGGG